MTYSAAFGQRPLQEVSDSRYDVLVVDRSMPGRIGYEIAVEVGGWSAERHPAFASLTAREREVESVRAPVCDSYRHMANMVAFDEINEFLAAVQPKGEIDLSH